MAKTTTSALLLNEVRQRLLPEFLRDGFTHYELPSDEKAVLSHVFPFGYLKRNRGDGLDIVEIQFDKNRLPKFVINVGTAPKEGVVLPWGPHLAQEEVEVSALNGFRLYSSARGAKWFKVGSFTLKAEEEIVTKLVTNVLQKKSEVDLWFEHGTVGKHMQPFGLI